MSDAFEPMHQPPNPRDLREVPPENSACARVRGFLRDYADGDLAAEARGEVETHVHGCRACDLALSRCEFEALQLRRAFGESWVEAAPRPGFARRAVTRLLRESPELALEAAAAAERAEAAAEHAPVVRPRIEVPRTDLARRVLARTTAELIADDRRSRRLRSRLLLAACAASVLLLVGLGALWQNVIDVSANVRLSVVRAQQLWRPGDGNRLMLRAGDGLGEGAVLELEEEGTADVEWYDASVVGEQPAAQISMRGGGKLLVERQLQLMRGSIEVESQRAMTVLLADGSTVDLGRGHYHISVIEQMSPFDQLLPASGRYGVRVDTLDGEAALLDRDGSQTQVIAAGSSGRYTRGQVGIALENLPPTILSTASTGTSARKPVAEPEDPDLRGTVLDAFGAPVAEARVQLYYPTDAGMAERTLTTNASGVYVLAPGSGIRDGYALLSVTPPPGRMDLSFLPLDAKPLQVTEGAGYEIATATLGSSSALRGRLFGSSHDRQNARVVPCFYDEVLGQVWPWFDGAVNTDRDGRFTLTGVPSRLLSHQSAAVLVFHPNSDVAFQPISLPESPAAVAADLRVSLLPLRTMAVRGMPAGRTSVLLEEVVRMPFGTGLRRHVVTADSNGIAAELRLGRGRLWLEVAGSNPPSLRPVAVLNSGLAEVAGEVIARSSVLPTTTSVPGIQGNALEVAVQSRFSGARLEPTVGQDLYVQGVLGPMSEDVQLYALAPRLGGGYRSRFLGLSRASSGLRVAFETSETEVLAIGPDGHACVRVNVQALREGVVAGRLAPLRMQATGTAQLAHELVPNHSRTLGTTWQPIDVGHAGARPVLYRTLADTDSWKARDLPAGAYQVLDDSGHSFHVQVQAGEQVEIR